MYIGRVIIRMVFAYLLGSAVTFMLFVVVAFATGELAAGMHSNVAAVLFTAPIAWVIAFWWLAKANIPPTSS